MTSEGPRSPGRFAVQVELQGLVLPQRRLRSLEARRIAARQQKNESRLNTETRYKWYKNNINWDENINKKIQRTLVSCDLFSQFSIHFHSNFGLKIPISYNSDTSIVLIGRVSFSEILEFWVLILHYIKSLSLSVSQRHSKYLKSSLLAQIRSKKQNSELVNLSQFISIPICLFGF